MRGAGPSEIASQLRVMARHDAFCRHEFTRYVVEAGDVDANACPHTFARYHFTVVPEVLCGTTLHAVLMVCEEFEAACVAGVKKQRKLVSDESSAGYAFARGELKAIQKIKARIEALKR